MLIKPLLISALESALNHYLNLADNKTQLLTPLADKIIAITITPFNETLYLSPTENTIQCLNNYVGEINTHLTGSLFALGLMGISKNPMNSLFAGEVLIEGDTQLGQKLQTLFAQLDLNLETKLARYTSYTVAHNIGQLWRNSKEWSDESLETLRLNISEFVQEETRDVPAKAEAELFFNQVDELRLDFDRLESRLDRLINLV